MAGGRTGELPRAVVCPSVPTMVVSSLPRYAKSSPSICAACGLVLAIRARRSGMSESGGLRGVLATPARATETDATETAAAETEVTNTESQPLASDGVRPLSLNPQVKLSTRLPCKVAVRLDHRARASGLSRLACHAEPVGQRSPGGGCVGAVRSRAVERLLSGVGQYQRASSPHGKAARQMPCFFWNVMSGVGCHVYPEFTVELDAPRVDGKVCARAAK